MRALSHQTVVITGASSGIGRETAVAFGRLGANVVLAARGAEALACAAAEVERAGGHALPFVTDVAEYDQVERLASEAVARFGRIDTWVNNAGVSLYGDLLECEPAEMEQVIRVNLFGQMFGTRAAARVMCEQGEGTIVNVASALALRSVPMQAAYCASKHGVAGFTEAARLELAARCPAITVTTVLPSSTNTPLFDHARSHMGRKARPIAPVYEPAVVAEAIVWAASHPCREVTVGGAGKALTVAQRLSSRLLDRYMAAGRRMAKGQQTDEPPPADNLFGAAPGPGSASGSFGEGAHGVSLYTRLFERHPAGKAGVAAGAALATALAVRRAGR